MSVGRVKLLRAHTQTTIASTLGLAGRLEHMARSQLRGDPIILVAYVVLSSLGRGGGTGGWRGADGMWIGRG
jgi:hypothetical protein